MSACMLLVVACVAFSIAASLASMDSLACCALCASVATTVNLSCKSSRVAAAPRLSSSSSSCALAARLSRAAARGSCCAASIPSSATRKVPRPSAASNAPRARSRRVSASCDRSTAASRYRSSSAISSCASRTRCRSASNSASWIRRCSASAWPLRHSGSKAAGSSCRADCELPVWPRIVGTGVKPALSSPPRHVVEHWELLGLLRALVALARKGMMSPSSKPLEPGMALEKTGRISGASFSITAVKGPSALACASCNVPANLASSSAFAIWACCICSSAASNVFESSACSMRRFSSVSSCAATTASLASRSCSMVANFLCKSSFTSSASCALCNDWACPPLSAAHSDWACSTRIRSSANCASACSMRHLLSSPASLAALSSVSALESSCCSARWESTACFNCCSSSRRTASRSLWAVPHPPAVPVRVLMGEVGYIVTSALAICALLFEAINAAVLAPAVVEASTALRRPDCRAEEEPVDSIRAGVTPPATRWSKYASLRSHSMDLIFR
mmetsp:Transcript_19016/g.52374  ORF Transcript_19016/g.52374 Transcript_19016/m.52374 type:complete len:509 (+) Transcript_19016:3841-5367(+)